MAAVDLPISEGGGAAARVRADATRNREKILCAASTLVAERGIDAVSMDDVARAAGVGTGTLYRRFGDRAGLALALLDEHTKAFQDALISGPPPLGPGAPDRERLLAFGDAYLDFLDLHADLMFAGAPHGQTAGGPTALYVTHLAILLRQAAPALDAEFTARALLDAVNPAAHLFARRRLEWPLERLRAGWRSLVLALLSAPPPA
ncbi:MAG: TetR/AcrR family transcriptional regulator [Solirubrobacteraceae bacterium]